MKNRFLASLLIVVMLLAALPVTVLAEGAVIVTHDSTKTNEENGTALYYAIKNAADGTVINVGEGTYFLNDGSTSRISDKSVTLVGAGTDTTIIESAKYGFVIQGNDPDKRCLLYTSPSPRD